jgi:hypothetical protein
MDHPTWLFAHDTQPPRMVKELVATFAERLALEEQERAHERRVRRAEQSSELNSPEVRIRAWEKLHGLRLPSDPAHPVLEVVAINTGLTRAQVLEEQRARGALHAAASKVQHPTG